MNKKIAILKRKKAIRNLITLLAVITSALLQTFVIQSMIRPANMLSSGFTGVAILIDKIAALYGGSISTSIAIIMLNVPVALLCYKSISARFTFFSCIQFACTSLFLQVMNFQPMFHDIVLNVIFGGFLYGIGTTLALKGNASTGGTDFIALFVSNRLGKSIWSYVFLFNAAILCIFGSMFGWIYARYSIIFQFISTKTIDAFHHRYERVTLEILTSDAESVVDTYVDHFRHGITCVQGYGGFSHKKIYILHTVVSTYEVADIIELLKQTDERIIVNVMRTEQFFGNFYQKPFE